MQPNFITVAQTAPNSDLRAGTQNLPRRGLVLLSEGDRDLRALIVAFLESKGWGVVALVDAFDALDASCLEQVVAAILDVRSTNTSGLHVLQMLVAWRSTLPIIVTTSFGDTFLSQRAASMGATRLLEKPFELEELEQALAASCVTASDPA